MSVMRILDTVSDIAKKADDPLYAAQITPTDHRPLRSISDVSEPSQSWQSFNPVETETTLGTDASDFTIERRSHSAATDAEQDIAELWIDDAASVSDPKVEADRAGQQIGLIAAAVTSAGVLGAGIEALDTQ